jgi:hypothetical protein
MDALKTGFSPSSQPEHPRAMLGLGWKDRGRCLEYHTVLSD